MLKDIILLLFVLALVVLTNVGVCIYGRCLQSVSWFWIIVVSLFGNFVVQSIVKIATYKKNTV